MKGRFLASLLAAVLLLVGFIAEAQQSGKVYRIGYLLSGYASRSGLLLDAFHHGMHDRGYVEGKDYVIEPRWAERNSARLPELANELVQANVDIIVAAPTSPSLAAHGATKTIPIVVPHISDPVEAGLVANLARPGGNVTGARSMQAELAGKRLEVLKESFPKISRIAVLGAGMDPGSQAATERNGAGRSDIRIRAANFRVARTKFRLPESVSCNH
jgi:putative tryptophan/tyrosine transport system substrate-binding protein